MQSLINTIALLSGLVSLSVVGSSFYLYLNKDTLIEDARAKVTTEVATAVREALPALVESLTPDIPDTTGPDIPTTTRPDIPNL